MINKTVTSETIKYDSLSTNKMGWRYYYLSFSSLLLIMVWFGIDTGPWVLREEPAGLLEWFHAIRTVFPIIVLSLATIIGLARWKQAGRVFSAPVKLWLVYGLVGLFACLLSPYPLDAAYWAIAYLSVFAAIKLFLQGPDVIERAIYLNYFSWFITTVVLAFLYIMARHVMFVQTPLGLSGYGYITTMPTIIEMSMSRSTGLARFAAIPGIISFVFLWRGGVWKRPFWLALFVASAVLIYLMQSRGAFFGFTSALAFVMLFLGTRTRIAGAILLTFFLLFLYSNIIPEQLVENVTTFILRGQDTDELATMTGRTVTWNLGWHEVMKSPIFGWGFQSDRFLLGQHAHNAYLYALMTSGFVGGTAFVGGLIWAWIIFLQVLRRGTADRLGQKVFLIQVGGILAFFMVRSIPEVSGAMFGIDLMLMVPVMAYLGILNRQQKDWDNEQKELSRHAIY
jgi:O-antigen ligase